MSDTAEFRATDALKSAREAASSDEVLRPQRLVELEKVAIDTGSEEENLKAAVGELRKRRQEEGHDPWSQGEVVKRHLSPEARRALEADTKETGLRRATRDISNQRLTEKYAPWVGTDLAEPEEIARWEAAAREQGWQVPKPTEARAADKIGLMIGGEVVPGLKDNRPITLYDEISLSESREFTKNYRDALDQQRAEMLRQLG